MNPILFYGAGHTGQKFRKLYKIQGGGNLAFLDSHKSGTLDGVPVYQPESVPAAFHTIPVLLTIHSDVNLETIRQRLINCGWEASKIWTLSEFYLQMQIKGIEMPNLYWLRQTNWPAMEETVRSARNLFTEQISLNYWDAIIEYRKTSVLPNLLKNRNPNIYRPEFLRGISNISFVDGGTFTGDTIEDFINNGIRFKQIFCFEPDVKNLLGLNERLQRIQLECPVSIFPNGLNEQYETLRFAADGAESSTISEDGDTIIQTGALDEMLQNHEVSFIKMDIEGSEVPAIRGSRRIIEKYHPIMAISVYHRPDHLWEIPLLLKSMNPNYHFYLRVYGYNTFDTVCYAVDEQTLAELKK